MSKHLNKVFNNWKILNKALKGKFEIECLKCNRTFVRKIGDVVSGKSKACLACYSARTSGVQHSETHKRQIRSKGNPAWKGVGCIPGVILGTIVNNASVRGIEHTITPEQIYEIWLEQNGKCTLSGLPLTFDTGDPCKASLDRIDSSKGYVLGNVQWVSKNVNYMKRSLSQDDFLSLVGEIAKHRGLAS